MKSKLTFFLIWIMLIPLLAVEKPQTTTSGNAIQSWLLLGPAPVTDLERTVYQNNRDIANHQYLNTSGLWPVPGQDLVWSSGHRLVWKSVSGLSVTPENDVLYYAVCYVDANRYLKATLEVRNIRKALVNIYLDGTEVKKQFDEQTGTVTADIALLNKKHVLLLKFFIPKGEPFSLDAAVTGTKPENADLPACSTDLTGRIDFIHILNQQEVYSLDVSPDGRYVAVSLARNKTDGSGSRWTEILKTADGSMVLNTENRGQYDNLTWLNHSRGFLYSMESGEKTTLYRMDLATETVTEVLSGLKNFSGYTLSPDNMFILYWTFKKKDRGSGFKYVETIPDRAASDRYDYDLYISYLNGGATHRVRSFTEDLNSVMISPDSNRVLISTSRPDTTERPYFKSYFHLLELNNYAFRTLFESSRVYPACWAPDSSRLLFTGGPSAFDGIGNTLPEGVIPNDYDTQIFIYQIADGQAVSITRDFDPSVDGVTWNRKDGHIYLRATDRSFVKIFRYHTGQKRFTEIPVPVDAVRRFDVSSHGRAAVLWGSGASQPYKLVYVDLSNLKARLLKDFNARDFSRVRLGQVRDWDYRTPEGKTINGRIHYPPDFDASRKYPCIVYYYGGTSPVERSFAGRYPFNWYAANGYVVYVLQPSGSVGFGQAFSAVHVNDWGKTTSGEIIGATRELIRQHPYIDPARLGAMGASYGGFMTLYLATQTDMYAAFISHAGISALSSYWGVGDWGYTYSGVATANSFPWNRRDIYVDQSPLFMADQIKTPLLLLHGDKDNNVPPGESYQMFAALKLLGKEVALVSISDQSHWIMKFDKRLHWMKTIMAWFDRWLKGEPEYWDSLYSKYKSPNQENKRP